MQVVDTPEVGDDPFRKMHTNNQDECKQKHLGKPLKPITPP
jgi:hypothetical protein